MKSDFQRKVYTVSQIGAEIRDIDLRLAHGFVAGEEEQLKARRKTLTDAAYKECFSEQK